MAAVALHRPARMIHCLSSSQKAVRVGGEMRRGWSGAGKGEWGDRWEQRPYIIETMHSYALPM